MPSLRIELATPCSANWDDMTGDERKRLCALCNKRVYNLDGLTVGEIQALLGGPDQPQCVTFFERADDTVLTEDCPLGLAARTLRAGRRAWMATAAALASLLGVLGFGAMDSGTCEVAGPPPAVRLSGPTPQVVKPAPVGEIQRPPFRMPLLEAQRARRAGGIQIIKLIK